MLCHAQVERHVIRPFACVSPRTERTIRICLCVRVCIEPKQEVEWMTAGIRKNGCDSRAGQYLTEPDPFIKRRHYEAADNKTMPLIKRRKRSFATNIQL